MPPVSAVRRGSLLGFGISALTGGAVIIIAAIAILPLAFHLIETQSDEPQSFTTYVFHAMLALFVGATGVVVFASRLTRYYGALAIQLALLLLIISQATGRPFAASVLLTFVLLEVALFEPYPRSIALSIALITVAALVIIRVGVSLRSYAPMIVPIAAVAALGPLITRYREIGVQLGNERDELGESAARLTRANSLW